MSTLDKPFFYQSPHRAAFLANMAGRIKDVICEEGIVLLEQRGLTTPVTDVSFILFLSQNANVSIADIARAQGFSHQRVASRIAILEKLLLVSRTADERDQRRKCINLTDKGKAEALLLEDVYKSSALALEELFVEIDDDLMEKLYATLNALTRVPLTERIERLAVTSAATGE